MTDDPAVGGSTDDDPAEDGPPEGDPTGEGSEATKDDPPEGDPDGNGTESMKDDQTDGDPTDGGVGSRSRLVTRFLQGTLALLSLYGLATVQLGMASNGAFGLTLTSIPALVRREYDYTMHPALVLWITVAVWLHSVGALGPYTWFTWYDSVTHTLSATVAGGLGYATFRGFERHSGELHVPGKFRAVFIVVFVLAISVVWELLEFASGVLPGLVGIDAPLVVLGVEDIVTDMVFNTLGALVLAVGASDYFRSLGGFFRRQFDSRES